MTTADWIRANLPRLRELLAELDRLPSDATVTFGQVTCHAADRVQAVVRYAEIEAGRLGILDSAGNVVPEGEVKR